LTPLRPKCFSNAAFATWDFRCGCRFTARISPRKRRRKDLSLVRDGSRVITSEREKIFLTFFSIVVDERKFIKHFGVDYQLVWDVVQEKLPELKRNVQSIIDKLQQA
jgi:hypothetical protein